MHSIHVHGAGQQPIGPTGMGRRFAGRIYRVESMPAIGGPDGTFRGDRVGNGADLESSEATGVAAFYRMIFLLGSLRRGAQMKSRRISQRTPKITAIETSDMSHQASMR